MPGKGSKVDKELDIQGFSSLYSCFIVDMICNLLYNSVSQVNIV